MKFYIFILNLVLFIISASPFITHGINNNGLTTAQEAFLYFLNQRNTLACCDKESLDLQWLNVASDVSAIFSHKQSAQNIHTSAWCSSTDISGLTCKFHNLCYMPSKKQFVFVSNSSSILYGAKSISELSNHLFTSSVRNHNVFQVPFTVVNAATISKFKIKFINRKAILYSRFKPDNLQHVFHDDLLPLYFTMLELLGPSPTKENNKIVSIIIDDFGLQEYDYLYRSVTKDMYYISSLPSDYLTCFSESFIGFNKMSFFYDYNFHENENNKYLTHINRNHINAFVDSFVSHFNLHPNPNEILKTFKIVLLCRKSTRKLLNVHDVQKSLFNLLKHESDLQPIVKIMSLEENGILGIIKELLTANIFIGMHGAALILALFLPHSSGLIELWPFGLKPSIVPIYNILCDIKEINYAYWVNEDFQNSIIHPEYPKYYGGIDNWNTMDLTSFINNLKFSTLKKITCCDNSEWLFRIYQDTIVNIYPDSHFKSMLLQDIVNQMLKTKRRYLSPEIPSNLQYLSPVENVSCVISSTEMGQTRVILKWSVPWNFEELGCKSITYEITIKEIGLHDNVQISHTKEKIFLKKFSYPLSDLHVWITSFCSEEEGGRIFLHCK